MVLTSVDQLWRADITYIRLQDEFVYLAVILDAYSRRVIGWALDRTLEHELGRVHTKRSASTMSAKERKARKTTSSFSKREKMRRKPLSRRNSRSISLRFL